MDVSLRLKNLYEKSCNSVEKLLKIKIGADTERKFQEAIYFTKLKITPSGSTSLTIFSILLLIPISTLLLIAGILTLTSLTVLLVCSLFVILYLYNYPLLLSRSVRAKASTEFVLTILYMSIVLRDVPNLEKALIFAASNLTGPIGDDLKRMLWDIQSGKYTNVETALDSFMKKWKSGNDEFVDALQLLKNSVKQPYERRTKMIDETVEVILGGTSERMRHYAEELKTPITLIYAMGIILPVMSLVLLPIVMIFLQELVSMAFVIIFYDLVLPIALFWFMNFVLERKPPTMSQPEVYKAEGAIPSGKFKVVNKLIPILPISLIILVSLATVGSYFLYGFNQKDSVCKAWQECSFGLQCKPSGIQFTAEQCKNILVEFYTPSIFSSLIILGISFSIITYCFLNTRITTGIRNRIKATEREFSEALFQLGYQLSSGQPLEKSVEKSRNVLRTYEISKFYERILYNMRYGMTFERALFDEDSGALRKYPSVLIKSIMKIIVETSKKSVALASSCALSVADYLKRMSSVEEKVRELLYDVASSMKFLAAFLTPLTASITVAMAMIVLNILISISIEIGQMQAGIEIPGTTGFLFGLWSGAMDVSPFAFYLVLGIYVIETTILLTIFVNGIEKGDDKISLEESLYKNLLIATVTYVIGVFITYQLFGNPIASLLVGT